MDPNFAGPVTRQCARVLGLTSRVCASEKKNFLFGLRGECPFSLGAAHLVASLRRTRSAAWVSLILDPSCSVFRCVSVGMDFSPHANEKLLFLLWWYGKCPSMCLSQWPWLFAQVLRWLFPSFPFGVCFQLHFSTFPFKFPSNSFKFLLFLLISLQFPELFECFLGLLSFSHHAVCCSMFEMFGFLHPVRLVTVA